MNILVLYQDIQSGAKIATEAIVAAYRKLYPRDRLMVYKQTAHPFTGRFSFLQNMLWSMWDFARVLRVSESPDIIISSLYTFVIPWRLCRAHVPVIFHIHGDQRFLTEPKARHIMHMWYHRLVGEVVASLQKLALEKATRLAFVSEGARSDFLKKIRIPHVFNKSFILPNGVDTDVFRPPVSHMSTQDGYQRKDVSTIRLGYVGRMDEKKGIKQLIASLNYIDAPVLLLIAYPTPTDSYEMQYLSDLRAVVRTIPVRHVIRFVQNPKPIFKIYKNIDFLVLPSRQEMQPLVLLEALATGVLPIVTRVGGSEEMLMRLSPRLLIPKDNPATIARVITSLAASSPRTLKLLRIKGRHMVKRFSWSKSAVMLRKEVIAILPR